MATPATTPTSPRLPPRPPTPASSTQSKPKPARRPDTEEQRKKNRDQKRKKYWQDKLQRQRQQQQSPFTMPPTPPPTRFEMNRSQSNPLMGGDLGQDDSISSSSRKRAAVDGQDGTTGGSFEFGRSQSDRTLGGPPPVHPHSALKQAPPQQRFMVDQSGTAYDTRRMYLPIPNGLYGPGHEFGQQPPPAFANAYSAFTGAGQNPHAASMHHPPPSPHPSPFTSGYAAAAAGSPYTNGHPYQQAAAPAAAAAAGSPYTNGHPYQQSPYSGSYGHPSSHHSTPDPKLIELELAREKRLTAEAEAKLGIVRAKTNLESTRVVKAADVASQALSIIRGPAGGDDNDDDGDDDDDDDAKRRLFSDEAKEAKQPTTFYPNKEGKKREEPSKFETYKKVEESKEPEQPTTFEPNKEAKEAKEPPEEPTTFGPLKAVEGGKEPPEETTTFEATEALEEAKEPPKEPTTFGPTEEAEEAKEPPEERDEATSSSDPVTTTTTITTASGVTYTPQGWGGTFLEGAMMKPAPKTPTTTTSKKSSNKMSRKQAKTQLGMGINLPGFAILAERPDNVVRIVNTECEFDLEEKVPYILSKYPNHTAYLSGCSSQLSLDRQTSTPIIFVILMPTGTKPPPPLVAFDPKTDEFELEDFREHQLSWEVYREEPRAYYLKTGKRRTKASVRMMDEETLEGENFRSLFTMTSEDLTIREIRWTFFVNGQEITDTYKLAKNPDKEEQRREQWMRHLAEFSWKDELGPNAYDMFAEAFPREIQEAQERAQLRMGRLNSMGYSVDLLDRIKTIKIYPADARDSYRSKDLNKFYPDPCEIL